MVKYPELGMPALLGQIVPAAGGFVKFGSPADEFPDSFG